MSTGPRDLWWEIKRAWSVTLNASSFFRVALDLLLCRRPFLGLIPRHWINQPRSIDLRPGIRLTYRLNKGDIWSLREVWLFEAYRFPAAIRPGLVIDLGANIGLASVWLATRYQASEVIAVEPVPSNEELTRRNLQQNTVKAAVIPAAVGSRDGSVKFVEHAESNFGHADYSLTGTTPMVSMKSVLARYAQGKRIDLLKMDIEGAEEELLSANLEWLQSVDAIITELHPGVIDASGVIATLQRQGFRYIPANSVFPDNMDSFVREPPTA